MQITSGSESRLRGLPKHFDFLRSDSAVALCRHAFAATSCAIVRVDPQVFILTVL